MTRRPLVGVALVVGAAALWATFGLFAKRLYLYGFTPLELASIRTWIGLAGAAVVLVLRRSWPELRRRDVPLFLAYGVLGFALFEVLYLAALERTSVSIAVALLYTAPAFVVLLSRLIWHERIARGELAALALVLAGVLLVTGAVRAVAAGEALLGSAALAAGIASGFTYALYTVFSKLALARYDPFTTVFWSFAFAALALLIVQPPLPAALREPDALPWLLGLGLVPTLFAYLLYLAALRWLRASTASMIAASEPVIAALLAAWLLGERLRTEQGAGMIAIVAAAVWLARMAARRATANKGR